VYKTHTIKVGYYMDQTGNNNVTLGSQVNGTLTLARWDTCYPNRRRPRVQIPPPNKANLGNTVGNFLRAALWATAGQRRPNAERALPEL
jgi:hypothetical protein